MKKFYLGALSCLLAMGASAQTFESVGTISTPDSDWEYGFLSIPSLFAVNGESTLFTFNEAEGGGVEFNAYNKSFMIERTIKVDAPTSYRRVEVEAREAVVNSIGKTVDCVENIKPTGESYYEEYQGYREYYYENYGKENTDYENTVYTDEYVYEWLEYMKEQDPDNFEWIEILEKREVDGGSLFVIQDNETFIEGFYFKENQFFYYLSSDSKELRNEEYSYYDFYNTKNAVFAEEYIKQYINHAGEYRFSFGLTDYSLDWYSVDSTSVTSTGETFFYTNLWEEIDGESYPTLYFVWEDKSITVHYMEYTTSYTGEWVKTIEDNDYGFDVDDMAMWPIVVGQAGELDDAFIVATQTLFNNDAKWEFIRPIYKEMVEKNNWQTEEKDRDGDGQIDYKSVYYRNQTIGYQIINEDGNVLSTIDVAENYDCSPCIIQWGDDVFFCVSITKKNEEESDYDRMYEHYWDIYSINKNSSAIAKIASAPAMRVSPTIAERNSTVNVTLGGETVENGGELIITDSNGRTIGRSYVEAGQTNVPVTTDLMGSGVYNITLTEKGQMIENARIIVK